MLSYLEPFGDACVWRNHSRLMSSSTVSSSAFKLSNSLNLSRNEKAWASPFALVLFGGSAVHCYITNWKSWFPPRQWFTGMEQTSTGFAGSEWALKDSTRHTQQGAPLTSADSVIISPRLTRKKPDPVTGKEHPAQTQRERYLITTPASRSSHRTLFVWFWTPRKRFFLFDIQLQRKSIVLGVEYGTP